jgi:hypothetical protein
VTDSPVSVSLYLISTLVVRTIAEISRIAKGATVAQQVKVILVDDIEGGTADVTLSFALDGAAYEIDLSSANADKFRDAVAPYVAAARKAGRAGSRSNGARGNRRATSGERRGRAADIRAWARTKGVEVSERGRIPARVVEQYDAAH